MRRELEMNLDGPYLPGKDRARHGNGRVYTTPRNRAVQKRISDEWALRFGTDMADYAGEVHAKVEWQNQCPKTVKEGLPDLTRPDADNVGKLVLDALNGVAFKDDKQVTKETFEKHPRFSRSYVYLKITIDYIGV